MSLSSPSAVEPLPQSVQQLADVIGRDAALMLVKRLPRAYSKGRPSGQVMLYVPKRVTPGHRLVEILGEHDAAKLVRMFAGEVMLLAVCAGMHRAERDAAIADLLRRDVPASAIREAFSLSPSRFRAIRALVAQVGIASSVPETPPSLSTT